MAVGLPESLTLRSLPSCWSAQKKWFSKTKIRTNRVSMFVFTLTKRLAERINQSVGEV